MTDREREVIAAAREWFSFYGETVPHQMRAVGKRLHRAVRALDRPRYEAQGIGAQAWVIEVVGSEHKRYCDCEGYRKAERIALALNAQAEKEQG
jgi:hypothetical protein